MLCHLYKHDSVHGNCLKDVRSEEGALYIDGRRIAIYSERKPRDIPWTNESVDVVIEATGIFRDAEEARMHLEAGAKKVLISAPGRNEDITIVMGVNDQDYNPQIHHIISNASCTINCLAPVVMVLDEQYGIQRGIMTTIHSFTNDQRILDLPHSDYRRARAAGQSIIPTTTGAAKAVALVLPALEGKLNGMAMRVPTPNVSVVDLVVEVDKVTTAEDVNWVLKEASDASLSGYLGYSDEPLVSCDYNGNTLSSIIDGLSTMVVDGKMIKVISWYDNEWGYSNRLVDLMKMVATYLESDLLLREVI